MNIFSNTNLIKYIKKILTPLLKIIFTNKEYNSLNKEDCDNITLNITSNMIGLGNSATISGLKEIENLEKREFANKNNVIKKFVLLNTASIQIIPFSIISIRIMNKSQNSYIVVIPILICSIFALLIGITSLNILNRQKT